MDFGRFFELGIGIDTIAQIGGAVRSKAAGFLMLEYESQSNAFSVDYATVLPYPYFRRHTLKQLQIIYALMIMHFLRH